MVRMVPDMMVHKSDTSVDKGGGGEEKKVSVTGMLANKPEPTIDKDGMDTLSMVVSIVRRTCSDVVSPLGS